MAGVQITLDLSSCSGKLAIIIKINHSIVDVHAQLFKQRAVLCEGVTMKILTQ